MQIQAPVTKWTKKWLRVALNISKEVTVKFPNTKQFINDAMEEECQKERVTTDEVNFYKPRSKKLAQKNIFLFCCEYVNPFSGFISLMVQIIELCQIRLTIIFTCILI